MMHDFSLTEKHVVFYDLPVTFDSEQAVSTDVPTVLRAPARLLLSALIGRVRVPDPIAAAAMRPRTANGKFPYHWNPRYPARLGVMSRDDGASDVRWFEIEPCYVFHALNAYDDGDTIVLHVARHPKMFATRFDGPREGPVTLERWVIDLSSGKVLQSRIDDRSQEFPRVNEQFLGRRHRYGYSIAFTGGDSAADTLLKHDLLRGGTLTHSFGPGKQIGEFVFEPNSPDADEDDGVLMGLVYDAAADRSDLVLLDAGTLDTVAAIHLPTRVPHGFHGNWVSHAE
jgi:carotenoid cleavage dioxygenase